MHIQQFSNSEGPGNPQWTCLPGGSKVFQTHHGLSIAPCLVIPQEGNCVPRHTCAPLPGNAKFLHCFLLYRICIQPAT
jgi:hypothetical protein